jgi:hypothetical protein
MWLGAKVLSHKRARLVVTFIAFSRIAPIIEGTCSEWFIFVMILFTQLFISFNGLIISNICAYKLTI